MVLDCKFDRSDRTGDMKLLALVNSSALLNFMSSSVAKYLGCIIRPNTILIMVKLANETVVYSL